MTNIEICLYDKNKLAIVNTNNKKNIALLKNYIILGNELSRAFEL